MKRSFAICAAIGLFAFSGATPAQTDSAERKVAFDVASQPLPGALNAFAAQSKLRIVFQSEDAQGFVSDRLVGSFTPRMALTILLASSSLKYEFVDAHTVEIHGTRMPAVNR